MPYKMVGSINNIHPQIMIFVDILKKFSQYFICIIILLATEVVFIFNRSHRPSIETPEKLDSMQSVRLMVFFRNA